MIEFAFRIFSDTEHRSITATSGASHRDSIGCTFHLLYADASDIYQENLHDSDCHYFSCCCEGESKLNAVIVSTIANSYISIKIAILDDTCSFFVNAIDSNFYCIFKVRVPGRRDALALRPSRTTVDRGTPSLKTL